MPCFSRFEALLAGSNSNSIRSGSSRYNNYTLSPHCAACSPSSGITGSVRIAPSFAEGMLGRHLDPSGPRLSTGLSRERRPAAAAVELGSNAQLHHGRHWRMLDRTSPPMAAADDRVRVSYGGDS